MLDIIICQAYFHVSGKNLQISGKLGHDKVGENTRPVNQGKWYF